MQKTKFDTVKEIQPTWHLFDARDQVLGRLAQKIADALNGKQSAHFSPNQYSQNKVVVINSDQIVVTGKKMTDKIYYWHTGFPKGLRSMKLKDALAKDSTKVIEKAVKGMLPKNRLQKRKMAGLFVYKDANHKHQANFGKVSS
ncbi:MAG: 50S ribosomal protein L13 [bacterium]